MRINREKHLKISQSSQYFLNKYEEKYNKYPCPVCGGLGTVEINAPFGAGVMIQNCERCNEKN